MRSLVSRIGSSHFADLVERIAQRNLGGNESKRIAGGLGCQCGRTRQTGIHLNHAVVVGFGIECILYITFAHDAEVADTFRRKFLQHFHLFVGKRAGRRNHDGLTRMDAQRVEVFHACYGEAVVVGIADHLEFNLFPALQGLFHQNLLGESKRALGQFQEFFLVGTDTAAQSAQGIGRTHHYGVTDFAGGGEGVFHAFHSLADGRLHLYFVQLLHKKVAVFGVHDSLYGGSQHTYAVFI